MPLKMFKDSDDTIPRIKHILAIAAGKGGVGKSSVTVNLAHALRFLGYSVGVMDTDIYGPSIRKMLPENKLPEQRGQTIIPAQSNGIRLISMAYFRKENEAAVVRAPIANSLITQFIKNVEWGQLDYLLIDFPPGTGDIQLTLAQQANLSGAIMVTTPQEVAVMDVKKAMHMFDQVKIPIVGIVENMSYYHHQKTDEKIYIFGKGGGEKLARESGVPFLGGIPIEPLICSSGDQGRSLFAHDSTQNAIKDRFIELAQQVTEHATLMDEQMHNTLGNFELVWRDLK